jgi:hypothetical protein
MVGVGDGLDNGEAQAMSSRVIGPGTIESLEGLEEAPDLFGWDKQTAIAQRIYQSQGPGAWMNCRARVVSG